MEPHEDELQTEPVCWNPVWVLQAGETLGEMTVCHVTEHPDKIRSIPRLGFPPGCPELLCHLLAVPQRESSVDDLPVLFLKLRRSHGQRISMKELLLQLTIEMPTLLRALRYRKLVFPWEKYCCISMCIHFPHSAQSRLNLQWAMH